MSVVQEPAAATTTSAPATARARRRRVVAGVVIAALVLSLGYAVGVRSPWTAHHPRVVQGTAENIPSRPPSALFTADDGTRVWFRLDDVVWRTGTRSDDPGTIPPCLRRAGREVAVEATVIEVTRPFGSGSYDVVQSVTCP